MPARKSYLPKILRELADHIENGLCRGPNMKKINPKYFYDNTGSRLFEKICLQPEYYLTRSEVEILMRYSAYIMADVNCNPVSIIELGSGSSNKTRIILERFLSHNTRVLYFPVDISPTALHDSISRLSTEFSKLQIIGVSSDYLNGIMKVCDLVARNNNMPRKKVIFFLGSSIGNFEPEVSKSFLRTIRRQMEKYDTLFISFDLHKCADILEAAYNDRSGITSKFNLNLLARVNRDLGGKFNLRNFFHHAVYNKKKSRIEMYIISKFNQDVYIRAIDHTISFKKNEMIHTENSYKYSIKQIRQLAEDSGFLVKKNYTDEKKWFDLVLLLPI